MEKKFDQLLNEKCSWSYKSEKIISTSNAKNSDDPALHLKSTIMTVQVQEKYDDELNNTLSEKNMSVMENENWFGNNIDRADETDETFLTNSVENISNKQHTGQQRSVKNKILKRKLNNKSLENNSVETTVPNSSVKLQKIVKHTENRSSTSSDNEVLQTRFPLSNDSFNEKYEGDSDDHYAVDSDAEMMTGEKNSLKDDINLKRKSPIIIQAVAYNEKSNNANKTIMIENTEEAKEINTMNKNERYTDSKQMLSFDVISKKLDTVSADSLSVEVNTSNTEIRSGSIELINTNNSGLLNGKNINSPHCNTNKERSEQTFSANRNDTIDQNAEPDVVSNEIIQKFFNGSFDVNVYKPDEILPNKIYSKSHQANLELCAKSNQIITEIPPIEFSNVYISEKNIFKKRKMNQLHKGQKKCKQNETENSDKSEHFTKISSQNLNMRKLDDKKVKVTKQSHTIKKKPFKNVRKRGESVGLEDSNLTENKTPVKQITDTTLQASNLSHYIGDKIYSPHSVDSSSGEIEIIVNESERINSLRKYKNKSKSNAFQKNNTFVIPRRNARNSSLIALKRIKEIENLENSFDNSEEICIDSEQEVDYTTSESKMQNKDKTIFELKDQSKNRKKSSKANFLKNLTGYRQDNTNDFKYDYNELECTRKSARSNKRHKKILFNNKLETHDGITDEYPIKRNRNKSINTDFKTNLSFINEFTFRKKAQSKEFENQENEILDYYNDVSNKDVTNKNCTSKCKKSITQCRHKTWSDLENELLSEFDNKQNVSKTVIVEKKQLIRKKGVAKDDLLTVSNTSMTQMISKSRSGNRYNMRYEVQNMKRKYMESIPNINEFQNLNLKGAIPKSTSILEKAISAMEKCTTGFITPQPNTTQIEWINSPLQYAEMPSNSDTKNKTHQFHDNIIHTVKENNQCTSNQKISFKGQARNKREKNKIKKALQISNDVLLQNNDENENFDADHLHGMSMKCSNIFNGNIDKNKSNSGSQALEIYSGKTNNPWEDLLKKLNLEHSESSANKFHEDEYNNTRKQKQNEISKKSTINLQRYNTRSKKLHVIADFSQEAKTYDDEITNVENVDERKYAECESLINSHENEAILLTQDKKEYNSLNIALNLNIADHSADTECEKVTNIAEIIEQTGVNRRDENQKNSNLEQYEGKKKIIQEVSSISKDKKCQKYKANMKDGDLKLKKHFGEDSDNSEDFAELKENETKNFKNNKHTKDKTKKNREKYNNYLKKLFEKGDGKNVTDNENVANIQDNKSVNHSNLKTFDKNSNAISVRNVKESTKPRILATDDDDIFSISSSDSEINDKKSPGSGILCDYFDE